MFFFIEGDSTENKPAFESIKHIDEDGREYWTARELQVALGYKKWEKFSNIIEKAKEACEGSYNAVSDHFPQVGKMVESKRDKLSDHVPQVGNMINAKQDKVSHHFADVRKMIGDTIKRLGGTMPENLPTPDKSVREIGQSQKKRLPKKGDEP